MPEAMLFAKLTLCSHGNGSCWFPGEERENKEEGVKSVRIDGQSGQSGISAAIAIVPRRALDFTWKHAHASFILRSCQWTCQPGPPCSPRAHLELTSGQRQPTRRVALPRLPSACL